MRPVLLKTSFLLTCLMIFGVMTAMAQEKSTTPSPVGEILVEAGRIKVQRGEKTMILLESTERKSVFEGDLFHSGPQGRGQIFLRQEKDIVTLYSNTFFSVDKVSEEETSLGMNIGKAIFKVLSRFRMNRFKVKTATATIGVKGTEFVVDSNEQRTFVLTLFGVVGMANIRFPDQEVLIRANQASRVEPEAPPAPPVDVEPDKQETIIEEDSNSESFENLPFEEPIENETIDEETSEDPANEEEQVTEKEDQPQQIDAMDSKPDEEPREAADDQHLTIPKEVQEKMEQAEDAELAHERNIFDAPQAFTLEGRYLRRLASQFARMVSKVAEDSADMPVQGDEEWDFAELTRRRFTGRNIHQCRMTRDKRKVAVVLDSSPSCLHQARLFGAIATVAEKLGDCELYDAPNFSIISRKSRNQWERLPEREQEWNFSHQVVLAFGDFDGIFAILEASQKPGSRIYWFSCEERPHTLSAGRRVISEFKGHYLPATNMEQLMKAMRRVR